MKNKESILRVTAPDKNEFARLWKEYRPFVIEGVANNWEAYKNWSNDYLSNKCGNNKVPVRTEVNKPVDNLDDCGYSKREFYQAEEMKFKDYIDLMSGERQEIGSRYMSQVDLEKYFPQLTADVNYPYFFNRKPVVNFWFGCSGINTHLHFDDEHNIFAQIRGRKKLLLFPPTNYLAFYPPLKEKGAMLHFSKVNPRQPDFELFPDFPHQEQQEIILEAGEMLYIPPFWWHWVIGIDETISLSFWHDLKKIDLFRQKKAILTVMDVFYHSKTAAFA
ncbi:MAG: cupin-like domain-containing protein [Cyanobacteria bacterium P01_C01_bin.72]